MFSLLLLWIGALIRLFRSRGTLVLENLVLRQQLAVLKRRHRRPSIGPLDKLFLVVVRRFWSGWKQALIVLTPETVVRWQDRKSTPSHANISYAVFCLKKKK